MHDDVSDEEIKTGMARAEFNRLRRELGRLRGVPSDTILDGIMKTMFWRRIGSPDPKHINLSQAKELNAWLERQIERARTEPPKPRHTVSKAPTPPWAKDQGKDVKEDG